MTVPFTVTPTARARTLFVLLVLVVIGSTTLAALVAPHLMSSGSEEIWECGPSVIHYGSYECMWVGDRALYEGNPWYYGIFPALIALAITSFFACGIAEDNKIIVWKDDERSKGEYVK